MSPRLNYTLAILWSVLVFKRPKVEITIDGEVREERLTMIVIGKGN